MARHNPSDKEGTESGVQHDVGPSESQPELLSSPGLAQGFSKICASPGSVERTAAPEALESAAEPAPVDGVVASVQAPQAATGAIISPPYSLTSTGASESHGGTPVGSGSTVALQGFLAGQIPDGFDGHGETQVDEPVVNVEAAVAKVTVMNDTVAVSAPSGPAAGATVPPAPACEALSPGHGLGQAQATASTHVPTGGAVAPRPAAAAAGVAPAVHPAAPLPPPRPPPAPSSTPARALPLAPPTALAAPTHGRVQASPSQLRLVSLPGFSTLSRDTIPSTTLAGVGGLQAPPATAAAAPTVTPAASPVTGLAAPPGAVPLSTLGGVPPGLWPHGSSNGTVRGGSRGRRGRGVTKRGRGRGTSGRGVRGGRGSRGRGVSSRERGFEGFGSTGEAVDPAGIRVGVRDQAAHPGSGGAVGVMGVMGVNAGGPQADSIEAMQDRLQQVDTLSAKVENAMLVASDRGGGVLGGERTWVGAEAGTAAEPGMDMEQRRRRASVLPSGPTEDGKVPAALELSASTAVSSAANVSGVPGLPASAGALPAAVGAGAAGEGVDPGRGSGAGNRGWRKRKRVEGDPTAQGVDVTGLGETTAAVRPLPAPAKGPTSTAPVGVAADPASKPQESGWAARIVAEPVSQRPGEPHGDGSRVDLAVSSASQAAAAPPESATSAALTTAMSAGVYAVASTSAAASAAAMTPEATASAVCSSTQPAQHFGVEVTVNGFAPSGVGIGVGVGREAAVQPATVTTGAGATMVSNPGTKQEAGAGMEHRVDARATISAAEAAAAAAKAAAEHAALAAAEATRAAVQAEEVAAREEAKRKAAAASEASRARVRRRDPGKAGGVRLRGEADARMWEEEVQDGDGDSLYVTAMLASVVRSLAEGPKTEFELDKSVRSDMDAGRAAAGLEMAKWCEAHMVNVRLVLDVLIALGLVKSDHSAEHNCIGWPMDVHPPSGAHNGAPAPCFCSHVMRRAVLKHARTNSNMPNVPGINTGDPFQLGIPWNPGVPPMRPTGEGAGAPGVTSLGHQLAAPVASNAPLYGAPGELSAPMVDPRGVGIGMFAPASAPALANQTAAAAGVKQDVGAGGVVVKEQAVGGAAGEVEQKPGQGELVSPQALQPVQPGIQQQQQQQAENQMQVPLVSGQEEGAGAGVARQRTVGSSAMDVEEAKAHGGVKSEIKQEAPTPEQCPPSSATAPAQAAASAACALPSATPGAMGSAATAAAARESPAAPEPGGSSLSGTLVPPGAVGSAENGASLAAPVTTGADAGVGVAAKVEAEASSLAGAAGTATVAAAAEGSHKGNGAGDPGSSAAVWDGRAGQGVEDARHQREGQARVPAQAQAQAQAQASPTHSCAAGTPVATECGVEGASQRTAPPQEIQAMDVVYHESHAAAAAAAGSPPSTSQPCASNSGMGRVTASHGTAACVPEAGVVPVAACQGITSASTAPSSTSTVPMEVASPDGIVVEAQEAGAHPSSVVASSMGPVAHAPAPPVSAAGGGAQAGTGVLMSMGVAGGSQGGSQGVGHEEASAASLAGVSAATQQLPGASTGASAAGQEYARVSGGTGEGTGGDEADGAGGSSLTSRDEKATMYACFLQDPTGVVVPSEDSFAAGPYSESQAVTISAAANAAMMVAAAGAGANAAVDVDCSEVMSLGGDLSDEAQVLAEEGLFDLIRDAWGGAATEAAHAYLEGEAVEYLPLDGKAFKLAAEGRLEPGGELEVTYGKAAVEMLHLWLHLKSDNWVKWREAHDRRGVDNIIINSSNNIASANPVAVSAGPTVAAVAGDNHAASSTPTAPAPSAVATSVPDAGGGTPPAAAVTAVTAVTAVAAVAAVSTTAATPPPSTPAPAPSLMAARSSDCSSKSGVGSPRTGYGGVGAGGSGTGASQGGQTRGRGRGGGGDGAKAVKVLRYRLEGEQDRYLLDWKGPARRALQLELEVARLSLCEEAVVRDLLRRCSIPLPPGYARGEAVQKLRHRASVAAARAAAASASEADAAASATAGAAPAPASTAPGPPASNASASASPAATLETAAVAASSGAAPATTAAGIVASGSPGVPTVAAVGSAPASGGAPLTAAVTTGVMAGVSGSAVSVLLPGTRRGQDQYLGRGRGGGRRRGRGRGRGRGKRRRYNGLLEEASSGDDLASLSDSSHCSRPNYGRSRGVGLLGLDRFVLHESIDGGDAHGGLFRSFTANLTAAEALRLATAGEEDSAPSQAGAGADSQTSGPDATRVTVLTAAASVVPSGSGAVSGSSSSVSSAVGAGVASGEGAAAAPGGVSASEGGGDVDRGVDVTSTGASSGVASETGQPGAASAGGPGGVSAVSGGPISGGGGAGRRRSDGVYLTASIRAPPRLSFGARPPSEAGASSGGAGGGTGLTSMSSSSDIYCYSLPSARGNGKRSKSAAAAAAAAAAASCAEEDRTGAVVPGAKKGLTSNNGENCSPRGEAGWPSNVFCRRLPKAIPWSDVAREFTPIQAGSAPGLDTSASHPPASPSTEVATKQNARKAGQGATNLSGPDCSKGVLTAGSDASKMASAGSDPHGTASSASSNGVMAGSAGEGATGSELPWGEASAASTGLTGARGLRISVPDANGLPGPGTGSWNAGGGVNSGDDMPGEALQQSGGRSGLERSSSGSAGPLAPEIIAPRFWVRDDHGAAGLLRVDGKAGAGSSGDAGDAAAEGVNVEDSDEDTSDEAFERRHTNHLQQMKEKIDRARQAREMASPRATVKKRTGPTKARATPKGPSGPVQNNGGGSSSGAGVTQTGRPRGQPGRPRSSRKGGARDRKRLSDAASGGRGARTRRGSANLAARNASAQSSSAQPPPAGAPPPAEVENSSTGAAPGTAAPSSSVARSPGASPAAIPADDPSAGAPAPVAGGTSVSGTPSAPAAQ